MSEIELPFCITLKAMAARVQTSYIAIRGEINKSEHSFVYGLNSEIERYLTLFYDGCRRPGEPIHHFHGSAMNVVDSLSDSGYHIVSRTYDGPVSTWLLERHETCCGCNCHKLDVLDDAEPSSPSMMY